MFPACSSLHRFHHGEGAICSTPNAEQIPTEDIVATDDCTKQPQNIQIRQHSFVGMAWCAAWLFTIGYLHLSFWRGVLAIILWPYYIGAHLSALMH
jgi:hypothetical protein